MINMPNVEDIGIYSADQEVVLTSEPGRIVNDISNLLWDILSEEKEKGKGIEVNPLAERIDAAIEDYCQGLIASNSDYFIFKEFHCYVNINKETAAISFLRKPNELAYDKDLETIERVKYTTKRIMSSIFKENEEAKDLYEQEGEAVLYLYGYDLINKNSPIAVYFIGISQTDWLKKYNRSPEDYLFLTTEEERNQYMMDHSIEDYIKYWHDKYFDEIEDASYGEDFSEEFLDDEDFDDDFDDEFDFYDEDDDDEDDDDSDLPKLPWNQQKINVKSNYILQYWQDGGKLN